MSDIYNDPRIGQSNASEGTPEPSKVNEQPVSFENPERKLSVSVTAQTIKENCEIGKDAPGELGRISRGLNSLFEGAQEESLALYASQRALANLILHQSLDNPQLQ